MPRGDKSSYTDKQKRKAEHIAESYEERGVPEGEAESRAWATVNKQDGGGKKSGSGRAMKAATSSTVSEGSKTKRAAPKKAAAKSTAGATATKASATRSKGATSGAKASPKPAPAKAAKAKTGQAKSTGSASNGAGAPKAAQLQGEDKRIGREGRRGEVGRDQARRPGHVRSTTSKSATSEPATSRDGEIRDGGVRGQDGEEHEAGGEDGRDQEWRRGQVVQVGAGPQPLRRRTAKTAGRRRRGVEEDGRFEELSTTADRREARPLPRSASSVPLRPRPTLAAPSRLAQHRLGSAETIAVGQRPGGAGRFTRPSRASRCSSGGRALPNRGRRMRPALRPSGAARPAAGPP